MKRLNVVQSIIFLLLSILSNVLLASGVEKWTGWETIDHYVWETKDNEGQYGPPQMHYFSIYLAPSDTGPSIDCNNKLSASLGVSIKYDQVIKDGTRIRFKYDSDCSLQDHYLEGGVLPSGPEGDWETTADDGTIVMLPMEGINIPIVVEKPSISTVGSQGGMSFDDDNEIVRMEVGNVAHLSLPSSALHRAPTLFIALSGFDLNLTGSGIRQWQTNFLQAVAENMTDYEVAVWRVDWQASRPMSKQIKLLEKKVKHYLKDRKYAWDVVLVGHSRGAVFAHHLADRIDGNSKVNSIQTYLLDPTASTTHGDIYPKNKIGSSPSFYGDLYYDGNKFASTAVGDAALSTISDESISGYRMIKRDYSHNTFASDWVENDVVNILEEHRERKVPILQLESDINTDASCTLDSDGEVLSGDCAVKIIRIKMNDFVFGADGVLNLDDGLDVLAYASAGPVNIMTVRGVINHKDGVYLSGSSFLQGASAVVNSERASVGYADPISDLSLSLGDASVSGEVNVLVVGASASIGLGGGSLGIKIGGLKIKISW